MTSPLNEIIEECRRLRKSLQPIAQKYAGLEDKTASRNTLYPFVLLLGNHSSGKSSFINHLLERKVQTTGVAPTDDNFTIIGPGDEDIDRNGPALVGDPDLGFSDLKTFGPVLVNHTQLKVRTGTAISDFMVVDSPGMIDSPVTAKDPLGPVGMDRGYNFEAVVRWYAERADVILLFFDPDKPGTTGETLSILTTALVGLDHKMFIILNKADQFHKIHDFARAYGSLCWNLSKVIPRKDLPRIHTMCLPAKAVAAPAELVGIGADTQDALPAQPNNPNQSRPQSRPTTPSLDASASESSVSKSFFDQGRHDLDQSRAEVIRETKNAPRRRIDNEISRLTEAVSALVMHCNMLDHAVKVYHSKLWRTRCVVLLTGLVSVGLTFGADYLCGLLVNGVASSIGAASSMVVDGTAAASASAASSASASGAGGKGSNGNLRGSPSTSSRGKSSPTPTLTTTTTTPATIGSAPSIVHKVYHEFSRLETRRSIVTWVGAMGAVATGCSALWKHLTLSAHVEKFSKRQAAEAIFQELYAKEILAGDEFTIALGTQVVREFALSVSPQVLQASTRLQKEDHSALQRILTEDVANLRRRASPSFPQLTPAKAKINPQDSEAWAQGQGEWGGQSPAIAAEAEAEAEAEDEALNQSYGHDIGTNLTAMAASLHVPAEVERADLAEGGNGADGEEKAEGAGKAVEADGVSGLDGTDGASTAQAGEAATEPLPSS
ncbi:hypothetical protein B484DRAFT_397310 [Ochromonadaceae sp. CCMP2298]|nr:hypothetical protein B484DRAFT_397310 [Ochromonadaceae sp. CCMP2298]